MATVPTRIVVLGEAAFGPGIRSDRTSNRERMCSPATTPDACGLESVRWPRAIAETVCAATPTGEQHLPSLSPSTCLEDMEPCGSGQTWPDLTGLHQRAAPAEGHYGPSRSDHRRRLDLKSDPKPQALSWSRSRPLASQNHWALLDEGGSIRTRRPVGGLHYFRALAAEDGVETGRELRVPIADQEPAGHRPGSAIPDCWHAG